MSIRQLQGIRCCRPYPRCHPYPQNCCHSDPHNAVVRSFIPIWSFVSSHNRRHPYPHSICRPNPYNRHIRILSTVVVSILTDVICRITTAASVSAQSIVIPCLYTNQRPYPHSSPSFISSHPPSLVKYIQILTSSYWPKDWICKLKSNLHVVLPGGRVLWGRVEDVHVMHAVVVPCRPKDWICKLKSNLHVVLPGGRVLWGWVEDVVHAVVVLCLPRDWICKLKPNLHVVLPGGRVLWGRIEDIVNAVVVSWQGDPGLRRQAVLSTTMHHCMYSVHCIVYTAHCKEPTPKIWNKFSQKMNCTATVPIYTFMCLWAIYIFPRSICLFFCRKYVDRSWENINCSQTHECGNLGLKPRNSQKRNT